MASAEFVKDYKIESGWTSRGGGFSMWAKATRKGRTVFIKRFLTPVYPVDDGVLSNSLLESRRAECQKFEQKKNELYRRIRKCNTGNIINIEEFFREGSKYYITTEFVQGAVDSIDKVQNLPDEKKRVILKLLTYNLYALHKEGVVHADIKPDNILIKPTVDGYYTAKWIDFDASFTTNDPPQTGDDIQGDLVYLAPEVYLLWCNQEAELSEKIDIFSLGIVMHELWCGKLPRFDNAFDYASEAIVNGGTVSLDDSIPYDVRQLISQMIQSDPSKRPSAEECCTRLGCELPTTEPEKKEIKEISVADYWRILGSL